MFRINSALCGLFLVLCVVHSPLRAAEADSEIAYIEVEPVIITNYLRAKGKKPGFVQLQVQIAVKGTEAANAIEKHQPLIRDTIIEFLSFTDEGTIKDVSKRVEFRDTLKATVNQVLSKHLGYPYAEELVITHYMHG